MDRRIAIKNTALLIGATLGSSTLTGLLQSCQNQKRLDWSPVFFSGEQAAVVSEITEMILPRTETPGAKDLKVDIFVDLMLDKTLSQEDQEHVRKGYDRFEAICQEKFDKSFLDLGNEERKEVLKLVEAETNTFNPAVWGSPLGKQEPVDFYRRVKQFTLIGYFTSEEIGKNHLQYDPIPGDYKGCIPYNGENSWTL
ncbi:gluconate 2-dehydrogenase subunit 3 family protein [Ulvibacterium sp.]|uniref:gluconate 2-dehydrogenase subunit 3 family protein n=1 Tax=Ulvibacterium sp. TaxID=2665914 RepID=UPI003BAB0A91